MEVDKWRSEMSGRAMTVRGPIDSDKLGMTLMHEHVFIDTYTFPGGRGASGVRGMILPEIDAGRMQQEIHAFRSMGGCSLVDLTLTEIGRQPNALLNMSEATDVNIIMGCGWYRDSYYPAYVSTESVGGLSERLIREIVDGVGAPPVRPGIIGEIGMEGEQPTPREEKVIRAACRAQTATGVAITTHTPIRKSALSMMQLFKEEGVDPGRCVLGHLDSYPEWDYLLSILSTGAYVQFDCIGWMLNSPADMPITPDELAILIGRLVERGFEDRLLISHDVSSRALLRDFGGDGFTGIFDRFFTKLDNAGLAEKDVSMMMVENPARVLSIV